MSAPTFEISGGEVASLAREGWSLIAGDTWALLAFAVLVTASLVAMLAFGLGERRRRAVAVRLPARESPKRAARGAKKQRLHARRQTPRAAEVIALAKRGAAPEVIARSTGLSHDAVRTILRTPADVAPAPTTAAAAAGRQPSPSSAPFAEPPRHR